MLQRYVASTLVEGRTTPACCMFMARQACLSWSKWPTTNGTLFPHPLREKDLPLSQRIHYGRVLLADSALLGRNGMEAKHLNPPNPPLPKGGYWGSPLPKGSQGSPFLKGQGKSPFTKGGLRRISLPALNVV